MARFTPEQAADLIACANSPLHFLHSHVHIAHPTKGSVPLLPYGFQKEMVRDFEEHPKVAVLGARQMGRTTVTAAYVLWRAMFHPDQMILLCAPKMTGAMQVMERVRHAYERVPEHIRPEVTTYNKASIVFDNGSKIIARPISDDVALGLSVNLLVVEDLALVPPIKARRFWSAMAPTLSTGGRCILASERGPHAQHCFMDIWQAAPGNGFHTVFQPWRVHPERDEQWAASVRQALGVIAFMMEHECRNPSDDK
jgi:hypothetical protein